MVVMLIFLSKAVIGGLAAISPVGMLDSSSCGPAGELDSSSSSMAVGVHISPSSLYNINITNNICHAIISVVSLIGSNAFIHHYNSNIISRICHAISSVVPLISSNTFVHRHNIHTSAEDQSLSLEGRGTVGRTP